jgi:hypothetical protein
MTRSVSPNNGGSRFELKVTLVRSRTSNAAFTLLRPVVAHDLVRVTRREHGVDADLT